jgi:hypothetical protein
MFQKIRKFSVVVAALIFILSMSYQLALYYEYVNFTKEPDAKIGKMIPHELKGHIIYMTEGQSIILTSTWYIEMISGMIVFINIIANRKWPIIW